MAEILIIHCHDQSCNKANWLIKGSGDSEISEGSLSEAAKQAKGRRTLVLIPATEVLITNIRLPIRNRQHLIQAIPFSLENELTEDIDQLHFAASKIDSENLTPVLVIAKQKLEHWLEKLESVEIDPIGIYPDLLCLPISKDSWSLYQDSQMLHARTNTNSGFSVDAINGTATLNLALQQTTEQTPKQINFYRLVDSPKLVDFAQFNRDYDISTLDINSRSQLTALLASHLVEKQQVNLLQGDYQRVDKLAIQWKRWLPAAVLAPILIVLSILLAVQEYRHFDRQSIELNSQIRQAFQQAFPNVKKIVDPKVQMEQQLKVLQGAQSDSFAQFASLFVPAASVVKNSPNTTLDSISFRDGQLNLQLTIKELQALDILKKTIEKKRLTVRIRSANASGNQVTSHLQISRAKP
ncbi:MAG: type II secretion system protein GspL [Candidatus Thiodiazotropha sp. (ex Lucinoma aequizonata)]|nr:type II secretion system protein GspL [Candidatus Thiodiazotropha sp. (ex Lucinoma aequizonata)]MCU7888422.1 type II secretion system protein GspL [Candidatus Thiodiazotropha sp. (ex Lucinoma aequizonata)]MCU7896303.1 type II secretion system protein GspL [Candidatus Thiodiazotropha sp. (ex Lucinoma aequizonata)]MCU7897281.1 type II secretion system protein GspL [Candidatus Thiodiazotropha sp. (ex Lucinoma aequizonata)]MCU7903951.1 type II secretion system protein GspL [Candidatus Thiodiazot